MIYTHRFALTRAKIWNHCICEQFGPHTDEIGALLLAAGVNSRPQCFNAYMISDRNGCSLFAKIDTIDISPKVEWIFNIILRCWRRHNAHDIVKAKGSFPHQNAAQTGNCDSKWTSFQQDSALKFWMCVLNECCHSSYIVTLLITHIDEWINVNTLVYYVTYKHSDIWQIKHKAQNYSRNPL